MRVGPETLREAALPAVERGRANGITVAVVSFLRREPDPDQQGWIAIQARVKQTLVDRLATGPDPLMSEQDADFLADHVADDLMLLAPSIPPQHWVSNPER